MRALVVVVTAILFASCASTAPSRKTFTGTWVGIIDGGTITMNLVEAEDGVVTGSVIVALGSTPDTLEVLRGFTLEPDSLYIEVSCEHPLCFSWLEGRRVSADSSKGTYVIEIINEPVLQRKAWEAKRDP